MMTCSSTLELVLLTCILVAHTQFSESGPPNATPRIRLPNTEIALGNVVRINDLQRLIVNFAGLLAPAQKVSRIHAQRIIHCLLIEVTFATSIDTVVPGCGHIVALERLARVEVSLGSRFVLDLEEATEMVAVLGARLAICEGKLGIIEGSCEGAGLDGE